MKLLVLDGNSILNRAFYGIKPLTTKDGQYTNAIYGFIATFRKLMDESTPDAVAVAFDLKAPTFRHKAYDGYKANRHGMPAELAAQMEPLKELLTALGYKIVTCEGFEADDILGTLANKCTQTGNECIIATGDRDSLQLVSPAVTVRIAATKFGRPEVTLYDEAKIQEVYGVSPQQLIDIKAIQGDASDCIPGVPGIGQKGAADLITRFHDLDNIYQNLDTIDVKPGIRKKLTEGKESAYMSRMLGTIRTDAPIDTDLESYLPAQRDDGEVLRLMAKLEFFKLIEKMGLKADGTVVSAANKTKTVTLAMGNVSSLMSLYENLKGKQVDLLAETDGENITAVSLSDGTTVYEANSFSMDFAVFIEKLFTDDSIRIRTHDAKPIFSVMEKYGIDCENILFDTRLAAYLLNPNASDYSVLNLAQEYAVTAYQCERKSELTVFSPLADVLTKEIESKQQTKLLREIEIPLAKVLASMENAGFAVDKQGIAEYGTQLQKDADRLQQSIYERVGYEFNINSPKQLGTALFEKLGLPPKKKTKSGYSTNAEVLEELKDYDPVIGEILEYRTVAKLKSTYCDGLIKVIAPDGRIHSSFNQTETRTGRISSTEPNLQNIPVRTTRGKAFRRFFVAGEGCVLVDADYSQIELRVLAHIANDSNFRMIAIFIRQLLPKYSIFLRSL